MSVRRHAQFWHFHHLAYFHPTAKSCQHQARGHSTATPQRHLACFRNNSIGSCTDHVYGLSSVWRTRRLRRSLFACWWLELAVGAYVKVGKPFHSSTTSQYAKKVECVPAGFALHRVDVWRKGEGEVHARAATTTTSLERENGRGDSSRLNLLFCISRANG